MRLCPTVILVTSLAPALFVAGTARAQTSEVLAAARQISTAGGATFTAPVGWSVTTGSKLIVLRPPEDDSRIAIVDSTGSDASSAVQEAWRTYRPEAKRPVRVVIPQPGRDGWDERRRFEYETSPNERAVVQALALRNGKQWTVLIVDATEPTFEKRISPIVLVMDSLRPKGYQRESFAGRRAGSLNSERIGQMKEFLLSSMKALGVPGASMALIDGNHVVFEGGFGVRELGKPTPVNADTLFIAASNTKGMATLLLAQLADEKRLRWDQPVTEVYPGFRLGDAKTTGQVLMKHLVCACTGLPRQDMEWLLEYRDATPASSLALLGTMQPTSGFGEVFQYSNLMAAAAGYIGGYLHDPKRELGAAFDDAMQKRIFTPLEMRSTTFDFSQALKGNHASPHGDNLNGKPAVASMNANYSVIPHRPAGGVWTSAHDLIRYVQLELNRGKLPSGKILISEGNLLERRKSQVPLGEDGSYGMGLIVDTTFGIPIVHHGGSMFGYKSDIMLLPDHGIGAVVLTNADNGGMLLRPFLRRLLEVTFDGKPEAVEDVAAAVAAARASRAKFRERLAVPADPAEVSRLAGHYVSTALGDVTVRKQAGATVFDIGEWQSTVASRKNDDGTVSFITIDPAYDGFEFVLANRSGKRALVVRDAQHEYVFTEAP